MKEMYAWVPWFKELSERIAENDSDYLATRARRISWKADGNDPALTQFGDENIDPFSFLYTLAGYQHAKERIYPQVKKEFSLQNDIPLEVEEAFIFPAPHLMGTLFHIRGEGDPSLLWRLFRNAVKGVNSVSGEDFEAAQEINGVAAPKLTQSLFLINPHEFLPFDSSTKTLVHGTNTSLNALSWVSYRDFIQTISESFPGCSLYEVNVLAYLTSRTNDALQINQKNIWQISSLAFGTDQDFWDEFNQDNCAFTGGTGKVSWSEYVPNRDVLVYKLDEPKNGDILLVRKGGAGHGIGVIYRNDYADSLSGEARIHVIWICKGDRSLKGNFTRFKAFTRAHSIAEDFRSAYPEAFAFLDQVSAIPTVPPKLHALNTILYGPPGTGKTYQTMSRSVEICDGVLLAGETLRNRYSELVDQRRIEFVTYHQSYGYEEFVEGIRPAEVSGGVVYRVQDGLLKQFANLARDGSTTGNRESIGSLEFDSIWRKLQDYTKHEPLVHSKTKTKDYILESNNGIEISLRDETGGLKARFKRKRVEGVWKSLRGQDPNEVTVTEVGRIAGLVSGTASYMWIIYNEMWKHASQEDFERDTVEPVLENYVLVIDEINRANISKVLGEAITLLEEDKRAGARNEISVTLPYSKESFSLPSNLYIVGTMNTADRSIALLDTALRRRFNFEEISPNPDLLSDAGERTDLDLPRVLSTINERLEYLIDRDHLIGHAWLMNVRDRAELDEVVRRKILPLIAEYFYDDWNKVRAVLGDTDAFVTRKLLSPPPGLDSEFDEPRYQWSVRDEFAEDAYEQLLSDGINPAAEG